MPDPLTNGTRLEIYVGSRSGRAYELHALGPSTFRVAGIGAYHEREKIGSCDLFQSRMRDRIAGFLDLSALPDFCWYGARFDVDEDHRGERISRAMFQYLPGLLPSPAVHIEHFTADGRRYLLPFYLEGGMSECLSRIVATHSLGSLGIERLISCSKCTNACPSGPRRDRERPRSC